MRDIAVGCGQITWSSFRPTDMPPETFASKVLAEIAQAGYEGAPANPREGQSAGQVAAEYRRLGLRPAPGYFGAAFWLADQREQILARAQEFADFTREIGCTELYVAPGGFDWVTPRGMTRAQVAGHVAPEDALSAAEFQQFADTLMEVGEITLRQGVRSCFHNHVGTVIETRDEIERLLGLVDPEVIFLGPDTGHLAWAGDDVVDFFRDHAGQIKTLHVKDIDGAVAERGRNEAWDYRTFSSNGVFVELGDGFIDFPTLFELLRAAGFEGWAIAETDVTPLPSALDSALRSRNYLASIGL